MKLKCMMILKDNDLSLQLNEYVQNNITLELLSTNGQPLNRLLKNLPTMDVLFFEMSEDCDSDFEKILSLSQTYKSLVLIINKSNCNIESHILSDIDYLFTPFYFLEFDLLIKRVQKKIWEMSIKESFKSDYFFFQNAEDLSQTIKCNLKEITVIEAQNKRIKIHTREKGTFLTPISMIHMLSKTRGTGLFLRVHRAFLIQKDCIESCKGDEIQISGYEGSIKIGVTYYKQFNDYINLKRI